MGHHHDFDSIDSITMLKYMISHNKAHIKELEDFKSTVEAPEALASLEKALEEFKLGTQSLENTLSLLEEK